MLASGQMLGRLVALALLLPVAASAQDLVPGLRDASGPRSLALGNAFRAMGSSNEAVFMNPAGLAMYSRFQIEASGLYELEWQHYAVQVSLVDSAINSDTDFPIAAGIAFTNFASGLDDARRGGSMVTLALAYPLFERVLCLGVSGKYLGIGGAVHSNSITMDAGITFRLADQLALAVVMYNIIDVRSPEAPRMIAFAVNYGGDGPVHLEADWRLDFATHSEGTKYTYNAGFEYLIAGFVWVRTGIVRDEATQVVDPATGTPGPAVWATGGFGVVISNFLGIDVAYRNEIAGNWAKTMSLGLKLQM